MDEDDQEVEMALPAEVRSHHTIWVRRGEDRAVAVRYAMAGDHVLCFGDNGLREVADGQRVSATVHAIAMGAPLATFDATVRDMAPAQVDLNDVGDLLANVVRGDGSVAGTLRWLEKQRQERRLVELVP